MVKSPDVNSLQPEALASWWQQQRAQAFTTFQHSRQPFAHLKQLSDLADELIRRLWPEQSTSQTKVRWCLIATGGYGRRELYPYSDLDLLLLHEGDAEPLQAPLRQLLHGLWDLGLKVGHAWRSLDECSALAAEDHSIHTALLDARAIEGDMALFDQFEQKMSEARKSIDSKRFIDDKLNERQQRLTRFGSSRFLLEPNVKEQAGALRDLHLVYWLARYCYGVSRVSELVRLDVLSIAEYRRFLRAHQFLATVRILLHQWAGRADERLTFDRQQEIGDWLGYRHHEAHKPVERFMKRYFQTARNVNWLAQLFGALLEDENQRESAGFLARLLERHRVIGAFTVRNKRLDISEKVDLSNAPILMLKLFALAQEEGLEVHPRAMQHVSRQLRHINAALRRNEEANALFCQILFSLNQPDEALSRLNEAGLLGRFIPDFAYIIGQIQYDRYHIYTVDEHTIRLIGQLNRLERGELNEELPLSSVLIRQIESRRALLLAAFCHDIAKGKGGQHEQRGVEITRRIGRRLGMDSAEIELAAWLVAHHLQMSHIAFSRDLDDPQTILDFIQRVQSPERLKCLLLLTVADIRAVGPNVWNGWKGALLRELFMRAESEMGAPQRFEPEQRIAQCRTRLLARLDGWPVQWCQRLEQESSSAFWLGIPEEYHLQFARLLRHHWQGQAEIVLDYRTHPFEAITHLLVCLPDHPGLLYTIAGCITRIGGSIQGIRSATLQDGLVVMLLDLQDRNAGAYEHTDRLERLPELVTDALSDPDRLAEAVDQRRPKSSARNRALDEPPVVYLDNHLSRRLSVIEIGAPDRIGLLYDITRVLASLRLNIVSSHITTYGARAVDVFYVLNTLGQKITDEAKITVIRRELLAMLAYQQWSHT